LLNTLLNDQFWDVGEYSRPVSEASAAHRETIRREFSKQAASFERPGSIFRDRDILDWIGEHVPVSATDVVLDVAGGSGQLGRYLAERARLAVVLDLTREMLEAGAASAREAATANVIFAEGDATRLPFADAQFDLVVSRFAFHHMDEPTRAALEMARVCKPGGLVAVIDLVAEEGALGRSHNELERRRDPSHTRALERAELNDLLADAGLGAQVIAERPQTMDAERWLSQAQPPESDRNELLAAFEAEANGGPATGLMASRAESGLTIAQTWVIAGGRKVSPD
jgi:ubiquinone/menaquinone biosynthesis C-methylase UbiE